jgi:SAM-dependent methyltransferase
MDGEPRSADWWDARYLSGDIPWDTGIVPPEVVALVRDGLPGIDQDSVWALDLGCGSGVSSRFLAGRGLRVVGIDLAQSALARGRRAAVAGDLRAFFCRGDVSDLAFLRVRAILALDIGCFHAIPQDRRPVYIRSLAGHLVPGALYLLYAFEPAPEPQGDPVGIGPAEIAGFAPLFTLRWAQHGRDGQRPSAWYLLQRA